MGDVARSHDLIDENAQLCRMLNAPVKTATQEVASSSFDPTSYLIHSYLVNDN